MRPVRIFTLVKQRRQRQRQQAHSAAQALSRWSWGLGFVCSIITILAVIGLSIAYANLTHGLPSIQSLPILLDARDGILLQPTVFYDRSGTVLLHKLENPGIPRRYLLFDPTQNESFSPFLVQTVIAIFDPGFWQHPGFDISRLTQPEPATLAERLASDLLLENEPPSLRRALRMRLLAAQITSRFDRARVLEWFLNSASYGHLAYGAESAAQLYLGKSASKLNLVEAALLAAALEAPALNPLDAPTAAMERQQSILDRLAQGGSIRAEQRESARTYAYTPLALPAAPPPVAKAFIAGVTDQLATQFGRNRLERGGLRITTTLDMDLQNQLLCTLQTQLARMRGEKTSALDSCLAARLLPTLPSTNLPAAANLRGSAIISDPSTGQILAYVADATQKTELAANINHAPGTLLTPFLAVSSFASGFSPATLVWDIPTTLNSAAESASFKGPLRLRSALANEITAPMQQILQQIGPSTVWQQAEALGLSNLRQAKEPSHLLEEGGELTLAQLAQAYGTFATQGTLYGAASPTQAAAILPVSVLRVEDQTGRRLMEQGQPQHRVVLSQPLAYLVHHILSDELIRWSSLGHPNALEIGRPAGAKVGRSSRSNQVWTAGYTPQRVIITHIEQDPPAAGSQALDVRAPAGIWHALMQYTHRNIPPTGWTQPPGVSTLDVCDPSGLRPTKVCPRVVNEVFLDGNEPLSADTLYQVIQINRETGRLATVFTPPELVEERTYMVIPPEAQTWGQLAGLPVPPTDFDLIQPPLPSANAQIAQPLNFSTVGGRITIRGSAAGSGFASYRIQAGAGLNPKTWVQIGQNNTTPVQNGTLAVWDTPVEGGLYALRLQVVRQDQRVETAIIQVTVDNTPPTVRITAPFSGQKIKAGGAAITLQAEARDAVGIQRVAFWMDGLLVGERLTIPFTLPWMPLPGSHTLIIKAYDLAGNMAESTRFVFTVE